MKSIKWNKETKSFSVKSFAKSKTIAEYKSAIEEMKSTINEKSRALRNWIDNYKGEGSYEMDPVYKRMELELNIDRLELEKLELDYKYYPEVDEINKWIEINQKELDKLKKTKN